MNIHHLDKEVARKTRLNHQTLIRVRDEAVSIAGHNRQTHGCKHTVGVDTNFMATNTCRRPAAIVEQHLKRDVIAVKGPVERDRIELIGVRIKEGRIQIKRTIGGHSASFTVKGDEGQPSRTHLEGSIRGEHRSCGVVKPAALKAP